MRAVIRWNAVGIAIALKLAAPGYAGTIAGLSEHDLKIWKSVIEAANLKFGN